MKYRLIKETDPATGNTTYYVEEKILWWWATWSNDFVVGIFKDEKMARECFNRLVAGYNREIIKIS